MVALPPQPERVTGSWQALARQAAQSMHTPGCVVAAYVPAGVDEGAVDGRPVAVRITTMAATASGGAALGAGRRVGTPPGVSSQGQESRQFARPARGRMVLAACPWGLDTASALGGVLTDADGLSYLVQPRKGDLLLVPGWAVGLPERAAGVKLVVTGVAGGPPEQTALWRLDCGGEAASGAIG